MPHVTSEQAARYHDRKLEPAELVALDDHLVACPACREQLVSAADFDRAVSELRADLSTTLQVPLTHPAYEELEAYLDRRLDQVDRDLMESHVAACSSCGEELRDLRELRDALQRADTQLTRANGWGARLASILQPPRGWSMPQLATAGAVAAAILVAGFTAWFVGRPPKQRPQTTTARAPERIPTTPGIAGPQSPAGPSGADVMVALHDTRGTVTLDRSGAIAGLPEAAIDQSEVRKALTTRQVTLPAEVLSLVGAAGTLMGSGSAGSPFELLDPVGTVVETDRPTFRWRAPSGAEAYHVSVFDANFTKAASSPQLTTTDWTPTAPLPRGKRYSWQVVATVGGSQVTAPTPPAPEAKFRILDADAAGDLAGALDKAGGSHLVRGMLYTQKGILYRAREEFEALRAANPQSPVAKDLLASLTLARQ
ncbi:MAG: zf-HC2 domain-containing protein [Acidobacteria bacterium]|nr:zf-HC2 domain-containing protein [Acidobacteriota bacterium]